MLTRCPSCHTVFRVVEGQLSRAQGKVRCGQCRQVFDGRAELLDADADEAIRFEQAEDRDAVQTPVSDAWSSETKRSDDDLTELFPPPAKQEPLFFDPGSAQREPQMPSGFGALVEEPDRPDDLFAPPKPAPPHDADDPDDIPEALRDDLQEPRKSAWKTAAWTLLLLLLAAAAVGQYLYYNRDALAQNAQLRPWLVRYCQATGCVVPLRKDPSKVQLLHLDMLVRPDNPDIVVIQATMVNSAPFRQPFPTMEISLSDIRGRLVALRRFAPDEYLPGRQALVARGMTPNSPLDIKLEIVKPKGDISGGYHVDFL